MLRRISSQKEQQCNKLWSWYERDFFVHRLSSYRMTVFWMIYMCVSFVWHLHSLASFQSHNCNAPERKKTTVSPPLSPSQTIRRIRIRDDFKPTIILTLSIRIRVSKSPMYWKVRESDFSETVSSGSPTRVRVRIHIIHFFWLNFFIQPQFKWN